MHAAEEPDKLHAATGYDDPYLRAGLRARRGVQTPTRLGRRRWQVASTPAHLFGYATAPPATNTPRPVLRLARPRSRPHRYHQLTTRDTP